MTAGVDIKIRTFDIFKNPATGNVSYLKLWTNIACVVGTFKFMMPPDPSAEIWAVHLGIVDDYVVARSFVSVRQQELKSNHAHETS